MTTKTDPERIYEQLHMNGRHYKILFWTPPKQKKLCFYGEEDCAGGCDFTCEVHKKRVDGILNSDWYKEWQKNRKPGDDPV